VRQLREEAQIVLDINSNFSLQRDSSLFTIGAWLSSPQTETIEGIICEHLQHLHDHPVTPAELHRTQQLLANDYIFSTETPGQLAGLYGYYQTLRAADLSPSYPKFATIRSTTSGSSVSLPGAICYYNNATL
jgi:predicted Zn-dependent peptidase